MRYLLDTHCFLWHFSAPERISKDAAGVLVDARNELHLSVASTWELIIKTSIGKLTLPEPAHEFVESRVVLLSCSVLDITREHLRNLATLPLHHRDPFDRMLIAQAQAEGLILVTSDRAFDSYDVAKIWAG